MPSVTHTTPQDGGKNQRGTNVQFTQVKGTNQQNEEIAGIDINTKDDVTCYNYQQPWHICLFCPNEENIQTFQVILIQPEVLIPTSWVLLDSGSTVSSICNSDPVDNIRDANFATNVHTNGGSKDYTKTASLQLIPLDVNFNSTSHENIIFLSELESYYRVTMDITVESELNVIINDHTIFKFLKCGSGLYYFDTAKSNKYPVNAYLFL